MSPKMVIRAARNVSNRMLKDWTSFNERMDGEDDRPAALKRLDVMGNRRLMLFCATLDDRKDY